MRLMEVLKRHEPATAAELAALLHLTDVAIRQHLQALEASDLVTSRKKSPEGRRGRPSILWSLTPRSDDLFPDQHAQLVEEILEAIREAFGAEGLERVLALRRARQLRQGVPTASAATSFAERVENLARRRTAEGFMAEAQKTDDGSFLLIQHNCPIRRAAHLCAGVCESELELFSRLLGEETRIERKDHLCRGDLRCVFLLTEEG